MTGSQTVSAAMSGEDGAVSGIRRTLFSLQDSGYRTFMQRLIPNVAAERVIGVRTPMIRQYARELRGTPAAAVFLSALPHHYFEENNIHAFLIAADRDYDRTVRALDAFLPQVDNWATCDQMRSAAFLRRPVPLDAQLDAYLCSEHPYTVRFGIEMRMTHYLGSAFCPDQMRRIAEINSGEYYVNMMVAWYFATALAKRWDDALPYVTERRLAPFTHGKTVQKAIESFRITDEQKTLLRACRLP